MSKERGENGSSKQQRERQLVGWAAGGETKSDRLLAAVCAALDWQTLNSGLSEPTTNWLSLCRNL